MVLPRHVCVTRSISPCAGLYLNCRIFLDIFLAGDTAVGYCPRRDVNVIPNHSSFPRCGKELGEGTVSCLICAKCGNQSIAVERGTSAVPVTSGVPTLTTEPDSVR